MTAKSARNESYLHRPSFLFVYPDRKNLATMMNLSHKIGKCLLWNVTSRQLHISNQCFSRERSKSNSIFILEWRPHDHFPISQK